MSSFAEPSGEADHTYGEVNVIGEQTPQDGYDQHHGGVGDEVAVVGGEEPFGEAASAGCRAYGEESPHHKLAREHYALRRSRGKAPEEGIDHQITAYPAEGCGAECFGPP